MRKIISSGSPYEPKVGISRAVRVGPIISVAGTAPLGPDGRTVGRGDAAAQARRCLEIIAVALEEAGASMGQVVRTRILLTRIEDWRAVAAVHGEFFREIRPVNTIMQVSRFIDPEWLVEIKADVSRRCRRRRGLIMRCSNPRASVPPCGRAPLLARSLSLDH